MAGLGWVILGESVFKIMSLIIIKCGIVISGEKMLLQPFAMAIVSDE